MEISIVTLSQKVGANSLENDPFFYQRNREISDWVISSFYGRDFQWAKNNPEIMKNLHEQVNNWMTPKAIRHLNTQNGEKTIPPLHKQLRFEALQFDFKSYDEELLFDYIFTTGQATLMSVANDFLILSQGNNTNELREGQSLPTFCIRLTDTIFVSSYQIYRI